MHDPAALQWLIEHSLLHSAEELARTYSGQGHMWMHPYAATDPRTASARASVWFAAYPPSIITRPGESVLATLGDSALWQALADAELQVQLKAEALDVSLPGRQRGQGGLEFGDGGAAVKCFATILITIHCQQDFWPNLRETV